MELEPKVVEKPSPPPSFIFLPDDLKKMEILGLVFFFFFYFFARWPKENEISWPSVVEACLGHALCLGRLGSPQNDRLPGELHGVEPRA